MRYRYRHTVVYRFICLTVCFRFVFCFNVQLLLFYLSVCVVAFAVARQLTAAHSARELATLDLSQQKQQQQLNGIPARLNNEIKYACSN